MVEFKESEHPRDNDGKFTSRGKGYDSRSDGVNDISQRAMRKNNERNMVELQNSANAYLKGKGISRYDKRDYTLKPGEGREPSVPMSAQSKAVMYIDEKKD